MRPRKEYYSLVHEMETNGLDADTEKLVTGRPTDKNGIKILRAAFKQNIPRSRAILWQCG